MPVLQELQKICGLWKDFQSLTVDVFKPVPSGALALDHYIIDHFKVSAYHSLNISGAYTKTLYKS